VTQDDRLPSAPAGGDDELSGERTIVNRRAAVGHSLPGRTLGTSAGPGSDAPVRQVGRYQILAKLGEGAMATVYRAFDPSIGRELVIKFLHGDLCVDAEYRSRFLREAKAAGGLSHANIVTVFDVGEIEGRPYIAMELLDGGPLSEQLKKGEGLPFRDVVRIGLQVANALDYAHSNGVFHRDIKPSNLLLLRDGTTIKVADFGIAHMEAGSDLGDRTRLGTVIGTPHYMSPEQATVAPTCSRSA
jgi:serine/threonine-protein kinase